MQLTQILITCKLEPFSLFVRIPRRGMDLELYMRTEVGQPLTSYTVCCSLASAILRPNVHLMFLWSSDTCHHPSTCPLF